MLLQEHTSSVLIFRFTPQPLHRWGTIVNIFFKQASRIRKINDAKSHRDLTTFLQFSRLRKPCAQRMLQCFYLPPLSIFSDEEWWKSHFFTSSTTDICFSFKTFLPLMYAGRLKTNQKNVSTLLIEQAAWDFFCLSDCVLMQL